MGKSRFVKKSPHVKRSNTNEAQCDEGKIDDVNQSVEDTQFTTADMEASPGGEVSEKQSCIKRGVPKITKPAPPVVAVKMADLLGSPEGALNEQGITEKDENVETIPKKELDSSEAPTETMERERKEQEDKLQKQQQQKVEKQKKEEETKAKKEEERKAKQEQKEKEKAEKEAKLQEKKQRADEAKAKKEQERLNKQQEKEREKLEKEREKQVKAEEKQRLKDEKEKMNLLSKDQKDAGGKEPKDRLDEEADFERGQNRNRRRRRRQRKMPSCK